MDLDLKGESPEDIAHIKKIFAESGINGVWRDYLKWELDRAGQNPGRAFEIASKYTALGEDDKAFEWFNKALDERSLKFTYFIADPAYDRIRKDPRYEALLKRVGLHPK